MALDIMESIKKGRKPEKALFILLMDANTLEILWLIILRDLEFILGQIKGNTQANDQTIKCMVKEP